MERNHVKHIKDVSWLPFLRQFYICSGETILHFCYGLYFGSPTVFIPQIRKEANTTEIITLQMESWLTSATAYASIPWTIILPIMAYYFGRRAPAFLLWTLVLIGTVIIFYSTTIIEILCGQIIVGILPGAISTISVMIFTEYTSPKYRGVFLTLKVATYFWGILVANAIGTFYYWKNILILMLVCCAMSSTIFFCPESPLWLASKGRFDECIKVHRWLNGQDAVSENELLCLIKLHKIKLSNINRNESKTNFFMKFIQIIKRKTIYKPILFTSLTSLLLICSGKLACSAYAIPIFKKITTSEKAAYNGMLILDVFAVLGMYVGCALSKYFKRKAVLICTSLIGAMSLFILSCYLYLVKYSTITLNQYLTITLLTIFSTVISIGPIVLVPCIYGELAPIKYRSIYFTLNSIILSILIGSTIKIAPFLFRYAQMYIVFLVFGFATCILVLLVYKYLPETKDRSLSEIQQLIEGSVTEIQKEKADVDLHTTYVCNGTPCEGDCRDENFAIQGRHIDLLINNRNI
ncbi:facilitated trehalose transporter Tret1-like isoform X2 [Leptidea sinapis]|uniref:facilitated trehalose transporter Tret1-like isoform X2 n=1 Tax=Leptidea sinapis TaxID=189913 RepID=UPI0021C28473|nr:facilitated trehalose transporter Tret1-like isoform X2 [Leptidea sinapis]